MTPAELQSLALKQAQAFYAPQVQAMERYRKEQALQDQAALQGLKALAEAMKGYAASVGGAPYGEIAGQQGQLRYLSLAQQQQQAAREWQQQLLEVTGQIPKQAQAILGDYLDQQASYQKQNQPIYRTVGGSLYAINPATGDRQLVVGAGQEDKPPKTFSGPGGTYAWQPTDDGWKPVLVAPKGVSDPNEKPPDTVAGPNGSKYTWQQTKNGWKLVQLIGPSVKAPKREKQVILGPGGVPLTNTQINDYADTVRVTIQGGAKRGKRLEDSIELLRENGVPEPVIRSTLERMYLPKRTAQLKYMNIGRLHNIAVTLGYKPDGSANKKELIQWITGHFPKAEAAPQTAAYKTTPNVEGAINLVKEYLGTPYSWGGGGPDGPSYGIGRGAKTKGFDCSALLQFMYGKLGIPIPRVTYDQWKTGTKVARNKLMPGDAVFFHPGSRGPEHVGIYIGGGQFIEAPYTGASVRISNLAGRSDYMGARRYYNENVV